MKQFCLIIISTLCINSLVVSQNFEWVNTFGGTESDTANQVLLDGLDGVYIVGSFKDEVDFDPTANNFTLSAQSDSDGYVAKYDSGGNLTWIEHIPCTNALHIYNMAKNGNSVLVLGSFRGIASFDSGNQQIDAGTTSEFRMFIAQFDVNGTFQWVKSWASSSAAMNPNGVEFDHLGRINLVGHFYDGILKPDPESNTAQYATTRGKGFLIVLDSGGNYLDSRIFGDPNNTWYNYDSVNDVQFDSNGNILVSGRFRGSFDFDFGAGETLLENENGAGFFAKYTSTGNLLWAKQIERINVNDVKVDGNDNIFATGRFSGTVDFDPSETEEFILSMNGSYYDAFVVKLDASGTFDWAFAFGGSQGPADNGRSIVVYQNSIYVTGSVTFGGNVDFDPSPNNEYLLTPFTVSDTFVARYNTNGTFVWAFILSGNNQFSSSSFGTGVAVNGQGKVFVSGEFYDTIDFDPGAGVSEATSEGSSDMFLMKLDNTTLDIEGFKQNKDVLVYPNPVNDVLYFDARANIKSAIVYNMIGQQVAEVLIDSSTNTLDLSGLSSGTYVLRLNVGAGVITKKVVKY